MKPLSIIFTLFFTTLTFTLVSQNLDYKVRGEIVDEITLEPLIGANVTLESDPSRGVSTDIDGTFEIQLPLGRHNLIITYLGYASYIRTIEVRSGKELVLSIKMKEDANSFDEVVVTAKSNKAQTVNSMVYASARTFSVEESNKFAAAVDDPLRMVQSYAGVVGLEDGNNNISIRGNAPNGLLWRMEGIDIPNPNHYADPSSSGGGVSVLSSQVLSNSDFSTGAFSAEYGNAIGGVFDLKLRKGNNQKREYTLKVGVLGLEAAAEGPFSKNYKGSYLINYRYSTLSIVDKLGVDLTGVLNYSDLAYHIDLPTKSAGTFGVFGMHGVSSQALDESLDTVLYPNALAHYTTGKFQSNMSVDGIKHTISPWKNAILNSNFGYTKHKNSYNVESNTYYSDASDFEKFYSLSETDKYTFSSRLTQKISGSMVLRGGIIVDNMGYNLRHDEYLDSLSTPMHLIQSEDRSNLIRAYVQGQYNLNDRWVANLGAHYMRFNLNGDQVIEPRISIKHIFNQKASIAAAYGLHNQVNTLAAYFVETDDELNPFPNKNLGFTKAQHFVVTYDYNLNPFTRWRTELYYQKLDNLPVGIDDNQYFALLNLRYELPTIEMVNKGKGKNYGVETTMERFLHNDFYYILTASVSESKYKVPNSDWLNTRYNTEYSGILTIGKDWNVGKRKQNKIGFNLKATYVGGQYYTPIDLEQSIVNDAEVLVSDAPYSEKLDDFFKLDFGFRFIRNRRNYTSTLALDLMNATNRKNVGGYNYNVGNQTISPWYQAPLIPVLSFKVDF